MSKTPISATDFTQAVEGVRKFAGLKDNWDNECALPISESAINRAIEILHVFRRRNLLEHNSINFFVDAKNVSCDCLDFQPIPDGGIKITGSYMFEIYEFIIPPNSEAAIFFEVVYFDETAKPAKYTQAAQGYIKNYDKIADMIEHGYDDDSILDDRNI
jgi:hypothetical protein